MPEDNHPNDRHYYFQLRQQSTNKSLDTQVDLLMSLKRNTHNICTIQEPYIDQNGKMRANTQWFTVYPSTHNQSPNTTRSIMLVNTKLLTNNWNQLHIEHPDITTIELTTSIDKIRLFNIYNNCKNNDALNSISTFMKANPAPRSVTNPTHYIWLSNFN